MGTFQDLTGQRFGLLVVQRYHGNESKRVRWLCRCDCGAEHVAMRVNLVNGTTKSCGCLKRRSRKSKGGGWGEPGYRCWEHMLARCYDESHHSFRLYGGRGVTVCEQWRSSFATFIGDVGPRPTPQHTIDRIDVNGNYEPSNCRWATPTEQARNRRNTVMCAYEGQPAPLAEVCERLGISYAKGYQRLKRRLPVDRARA